METNAVPEMDLADNPTGCCPRFHPETWQDVELRFRDKPFLRAETRSAMHVPLNMGKVFSRVQQHMEAAGAVEPANFFVLSRDLSPWKGEHLFAANSPVPDEEMTTLSGDFITRVYDGPFSQAKTWYDEMKSEAAKRGKPDGEVWFYYTTCPKCAKVYGHNYVVGVAEV